MQNPTNNSEPQRLTKKAFLNAFSAFIDFGAKVGVTLVITPVMVTGLGSMLYGVWQVLGRLVGYIAAADGQPSQALKWFIANHQGADDFDIKRRAVGCAIGVWILLSPVLAIGGATLVWMAPILTKTTGDVALKVRIACILLVVNMIISGIATISGAVLRGMNLGYKRMGIVAGLNILGGCLTAGAIYLEWGLIGIGVANVIQTVISGLVLWYIVKLYLPWFGAARVELKEIRQFFRLSIWFALWNIANKILIYSDVLIIAAFLSTSAVTDYVLTGYAAQTLTSVMAMMVGAAAPGLGGLVGQKKYFRVIELRDEMIRLNSIFATIIGSLILLWNQSFLLLWVGNHHFAGTWVNLLQVLIVVQLFFLRSETYLIDLTLKVRLKVLLGFTAAGVSLCLAIFFAELLGVLGVCLGLLLGRLILTIGYPILTGRFFGINLTSQLHSLLRQVFTMISLFAISAFIGKNVLVKSWYDLILLSGASTLVLFVMSFFCGLTLPQRKQVAARIGVAKFFQLKKLNLA